jgi:hypothetical protein
MTQERPCERCHSKPAKNKYRFCTDCNKRIKKEMSSDGYLTPTNSYSRSNRTRDMKEDQHETKYGIDD